MAAFKQHITVSSFVGVGYTAVLGNMGIEWVHGALAGGLCAVSGMLPDLDSDSGKPVRELFGVTAALVPLLLLERWRHGGFSPEETVLFAAGLYFVIRFLGAWLFRYMTVHRGMFHSLPAAIIAGEIAFLAHTCPEPSGRFVLAGGVLLGFLSHLVLDELYSVDASGVVIRLNKAAGSAIKLFSRSIPATAAAWLLMGLLTYLVCVDQGYLEPIDVRLDSLLAVNVRK